MPYRSSISRHKPPQSTPTFTWLDQTGLAALCFYPSSFTHCRVIVRFTTSRPSYRVITAYPRQVRNRVEGQQSARFYWLSPKITNLCKVCSGLGVPKSNTGSSISAVPAKVSPNSVIHTLGFRLLRCYGLERATYELARGFSSSVSNLSEISC